MLWISIQSQQTRLDTRMSRSKTRHPAISNDVVFFAVIFLGWDTRARAAFMYPAAQLCSQHGTTISEAVCVYPFLDLLQGLWSDLGKALSLGFVIQSELPRRTYGVMYFVCVHLVATTWF